jgi:signal transduction histidine kinase
VLCLSAAIMADNPLSSSPPAKAMDELRSGWRGWLRRADPSVLAEQLSVNFSNYVFNSAVSLFIVLYLYFTAVRLPPGRLIHIWVAVFCAYLVVRMLSGLIYGRLAQPKGSALWRWEWLLLANQAFYSVMVVALALGIYPELDSDAQVVVMTGALLLVGSTAFSLSGHLKALALTGPPPYLAFAWSALQLNNPYALGLSVVIVALLGLYVMYALKHRRSLHRGFALAGQIGELAQQLQTKNEELQEVAAGRSRLLATVSHDLRQPAHAIGLLTEQALLDPAHVASRQTLRDLHGLSQSLSASLATLMDLTRLDAGLVQARIAPLALAPMLERLQVEYGPSARHKTLQLSVAGSRAWVKSDPVLLHAILGNLLANAIKYTRQGQVQVLIEEGDAQIRVVVKDSGIGIAPEQLERIFREFVRLDSSQPGTEGLGLGLSIVRRYAALLSHRIEVQSRPDEGSRFVVILERAQPDVRAQPQLPVAQANHSRLQGLRVLVVDNVDLLLTSMERTLSAWGCTVSTAECLTQAMARQAEQPLDLIISDFHLGDREPDGLTVIETLRSLHAGPEPLPAILLTGDVAPELEARAAQAGAQIMHKPVRPAQLQRRILQLLDAA